MRHQCADRVTMVHLLLLYGIFAALAPARRFRCNAQADLSWEIALIEGFPTITFDQGSLDSEIVFKYSFDGGASGHKYLVPSLWRVDCLTKGDPDALLLKNSTSGTNLTVEIDVDQASIDPSSYWILSRDGLNATIEFCLRVDYMAVFDGIHESINFHETKVFVNVDLTAGFALKDVDVGRQDIDVAATFADLDYKVTPYFCDGKNREAPRPSAFRVGDFIQVCIKVADEIQEIEENIFVEDILVFIVSQLGNVKFAAEPTVAIDRSIPDTLTQKICGTPDGQCNVKHQLTSKFFDAIAPGALQIDGIALLGLGIPGEGVRYLHVPVRRLEEPTDSLNAEFVYPISPLLNENNLTVNNGMDSDYAESEENGNGETLPPSLDEALNLGLVIGTSVGGVAACRFLCFLLVAIARRRRKREKEQKEEHSDADTGSLAGPSQEVIPPDQVGLIGDVEKAMETPLPCSHEEPSIGFDLSKEDPYIESMEGGDSGVTPPPTGPSGAPTVVSTISAAHSAGVTTLSNAIAPSSDTIADQTPVLEVDYAATALA